MAVTLVVLFHAGVDTFEGGFVGVDVFFVLSGYLVTNLLLRDLERPEGRVRLGRFYSRRVRRLLPAAALNLVVTAIVFSAVAAPVELADAREGIRAAALYIANWHFIAQAGDYFAADVNTNPVVHYWSLAVEEQFYLAWPLLLGGLWALARRWSRRRLVVVQVVIGAAVLASAGAALARSAEHLDRAYYGTDTRAYQLLAGALIAVAPGMGRVVDRVRPSVTLRVLVACLLPVLVVAGTSLTGLDPLRRGVLVTALTCALLVALETGWGDVGRWLLSVPAVVYLGKVSYGTYLWHWLVIVVLARRADLSPVSTAAVTLVVATGVASLSYQIIEQPIRLAPSLDRVRGVVITAGLASSVAVGLFAAPLILDRSTGGPSIAADPGGVVSSNLPTQATIDAAFFDRFEFGSCEVSGPVACPLIEGEGQTALVVGDSHAAMLTPTLMEVARRHDVRLLGGYLSYCPWTSGLRYLEAGPDCLADQADLFDRILPELDPDIVVLAHQPVDDPVAPVDLRDDGRRYEGASPEQAAALRAAIESLVGSLRADGRTVVMIEPIPVVAEQDDTLTCLSGATSVDECRFVATVGPGAEERTMRRLARRDPEVISVDLDPLVCPYLPICDPVVRGLIVKADATHLTVEFALTFVDEVDATSPIAACSNASADRAVSSCGCAGRARRADEAEPVAR